jgi:RNA polymerase sporulation-specific sigma factor
MDLSDENLARLARDGDSAAMDTLLTRYKGVVLQCSRRFFLTGGAGDDLFQEGMIGLYRAILRFDGEKNPRFKSFASLCIKRRIIDAVRKNNTSKNYALNNCVSLDGLGLTSDFSDPEERIISIEAYEELKAESKNLSRLERIILEKYLDGKSYSEIALEIQNAGAAKNNETVKNNETAKKKKTATESVGMTEKNVDNAIQRIRRKLKN